MYTGQNRCAPPCQYMFVPIAWPCCDTVAVPRDVEADATDTTATALVGGPRPASLSVEYLVDPGASSPSVTVTLAAPDGTSSDWTDAAPPAGYQVREALLTAQPGTKLTLTVNNTTARVRWCEQVCC